MRGGPGRRPAQPAGRVAVTNIITMRRCDLPIALHHILCRTIACAAFRRDSDVTAYHSRRRGDYDSSTVQRRYVSTASVPLTARKSQTHYSGTRYSQVTLTPPANDNANVATVRVRFIRRSRKRHVRFTWLHART